MAKLGLMLASLCTRAHKMDYVEDTIDAEPSVDIALDAAQFQAAAYDEDAEADTQQQGAPASAPSTPASTIPEGVVNFMQSLNSSIRNREISQIFHLYENIFNRLTERFYKNYPWPQPEVAQQLVGGGMLTTTSTVFGFVLICFI